MLHKLKKKEIISKNLHGARPGWFMKPFKCSKTGHKKIYLPLPLKRFWWGSLEPLYSLRTYNSTTTYRAFTTCQTQCSPRSHKCTPDCPFQTHSSAAFPTAGSSSSHLLRSTGGTGSCHRPAVTILATIISHLVHCTGAPDFHPHCSPRGGQSHRPS